MRDEQKLELLEQLEGLERLEKGFCLPLYIWADQESIYLPDSIKSILALYSIDYREVERDDLTYLAISLEHYTAKNPDNINYGGYLSFSKQLVFLMEEPLLTDKVS